MESLSLRERAYNYIHSEIVAGRLTAGSQVSEQSLAARMGISRTPVREAIRQLASEGLVEQVPRFGTIVRMPSRRDITELYELREALESYAVAQAARQINPNELAPLTRLCTELQSLSQQLSQSRSSELDDAMMRRFLAADMGFHMRVLQAAGNRRIMKAVAESRILTRIFGMRRQAHDLNVVQKTNRFHHGILVALRAADAEGARKLMAEHIQASCAGTLEHFDETQRGITSEPPPLALGIPADLVEELKRIEGQAASGGDSADELAIGNDAT